VKKALTAIAATSGLAVALAINTCVFLGLLPVWAAALIGLALVLIFETADSSHPKRSFGKAFSYVSAAPRSRAAENGEVYVITGKSVHNNPSKFE
jgi:hypothetical protein